MSSTWGFGAKFHVRFQFLCCSQIHSHIYVSGEENNLYSWNIHFLPCTDRKKGLENLSNPLSIIHTLVAMARFVSFGRKKDCFVTKTFFTAI